MSNDKNRLRVGDIVTLKSGGPRMTVRKEMGTSKWECSWFTKNDEVKSDTFISDTLDCMSRPASNAEHDAARKGDQIVTNHPEV